MMTIMIVPCCQQVLLLLLLICFSSLLFLDGPRREVRATSTEAIITTLSATDKDNANNANSIARQREQVLKLSISSSSSSSSSSLLRGGGGDDDDGRIQQQRHRRTLEKKPMLVGDWESIPMNPIEPWVGEAQGMLLGTDLVITGGFRDDVWHGTNQTTAYDLSMIENPTWRILAPNPINFLTHAGHATKGNHLMYLCGGYYAAHPGDEMNDCIVFNKTNGDDVGSWSSIQDLTEGRGGGALLYIKEMDSLLYTLGATRGPNRDATTRHMLDLSAGGSNWSNIGDSPYQGNHVSAITARDCKGNRRYYVLGGQKRERERDGNIDLLYEYIPDTNTFIQRANMLEKKGHFTTAIAPYGCGFITVGGAINQEGGASTDALDYYDIDEDMWMNIGKYPKVQKTQVCAIYGDVLTCSTGYTNIGYKVKLSFSATTTILEASFEENRQGFVYNDNIFRTESYSGPTSSDYAIGWWKNDGGLYGSGGLRIRLGGTDNLEIRGISGGFSNSFTLMTNAVVKVEFDYKFETTPRYYTGEYSEVLLSVGDELYGIGDDDNIDYIAKNTGIDGFNDNYPIVWKKAAVYIGYLVAGTYTISIGGYNNKKSHQYSRTLIDFDNMKVTATTVA